MPRTTDNNPLTAEQRRLRASFANDIRWSRVPYPDRPAHTARARAAFWQKFLDQVDPDGTMHPDERVALARQACRAHMTQLSYRAARAKAAKAAKREGKGRAGNGQAA